MQYENSFVIMGGFGGNSEEDGGLTATVYDTIFKFEPGASTGWTMVKGV